MTYEVEMLDPKKLKGNTRNFKQHPPRQVVALDQSLDEQGWVLPVLWNKRTGRLVDGHARVRLAKEKGESAIPVHVLDLDESQERRLLASLDRITGLAEVDDQALAKLLQECGGPDDLPPGYTAEEYDMLLLSLGTDLTGEKASDPADEPFEEDLPLSHIRMVQLFYSTPDLERFEEKAAHAQERSGCKNVSETMLWLLDHCQ